jgi:hypothetical protein
MAKDTKFLEGMNPFKDLNVNAERAVEQTKEQALGAVDSYFNFVQQAISSYPSGGTDLGEKLKSYAENNITAMRAFVHKLSQAKDFQDVMRIQTEFMQMQMNAFGEQSKTLGEAYTKAASGAMNQLPKTPSRT